MWFTRVSIGNPVMAVMVMLAFVVLIIAVPFGTVMGLLAGYFAAA